MSKQTSSKPTAILNAQIVNEGSVTEGHLLIDSEGRISRICAGSESLPIPENAETVDAAGQYLFPGVIDTHVHFRDPGLTHKADITTESLSAVSGGVTSFLDMPNTSPATISSKALEEKKASAAGRSYANFGFYLGATRRNIEEIKRADHREIPAIKLFMGSSTGDMQVEEDAALNAIFQHSPLLIATHCETDDVIRRNTKLCKAKYPEGIPFRLHPQIRPSYGCADSILYATELAQMHNARLHILHISSQDELDILAEAKHASKGRITGETCPHYLLFDDSDYNALSWRIKCNPAIKGKTDQLALHEALREGAIDTIGSDHAPHLIQEKLREYTSCPSGMPSVEYTLRLMLDLAEEIDLPIPQVAALMSHRPASLYGVENRGYIREGYYADLVLVQRHQTPRSLLADGIRTKCGWSPYVLRNTLFSITHTWVNGHTAYTKSNGSYAPKGRALSFNGNQRKA